MTTARDPFLGDISDFDFWLGTDVACNVCTGGNDSSCGNDSFIGKISNMACI
ncbi:MAG: hypothetical protein ACPKQO_00940 [Nitrososphaeraceae archaeon]